MDQQLAPALAQLRLGGFHHRPAPPNPDHDPNPQPNSVTESVLRLRASRSTAFKREERRKHRERRRQRKLQQLLLSPILSRPRPSDNPTAPDLPWPCEPEPVPPPTTSWCCHPTPAAVPPPPTEGQDSAAAALAQRNALQASLAFFSPNAGSDGEDSADEDGALAFFTDLFENDGGLRDYYKEKREKGEFRCLVCGAVGEKAGRRFASCSALVHHSITISRTKKRLAHREFASAVCQLLGWDAQVADMAKNSVAHQIEEHFEEEVDLDVGIDSCIVDSMESVEEEGVVW